MENITITFLGTGSAVPTKKRNHTALLLSYKNETLLIDCGEGTQRQFRYAKLSPSKITKILITHWHGDHILGLPGLFQTLAMAEYSKTLPLYGPRGSDEKVSLINELTKIKIDLEVHEASGTIFENDEFYLEARAMKHGAPALAYAFVIKDKLRLDKKKIAKLPHSPLLGELANGKDVVIEGKKIKSKDVTYLEKGRKVVFILDTLPNENAVSLAQGADLLVCESSFTLDEKDMAEEKKHLTAHDAAMIAKKAKVGKLILTHISQRYEFNTKPVLDEAKKVFKNVALAKDLERVVL